MKIHMRFDSSNEVHTAFTLFLNGGNCGTLVARTDEAAHLHQIIASGCAKDVDEFVSTGSIYAPQVTA